MLLTARAGRGRDDDRGVIGDARSADLLTWQVEPPLSRPGSGFGQLEVPQVELVDGRPVLISNPSPITACTTGGWPGSETDAGR